MLSTVGSSIVTGWNLLSSAASFPMVLRYSSAVKYRDKGDVHQNSKKMMMRMLWG